MDARSRSERLRIRGKDSKKKNKLNVKESVMSGRSGGKTERRVAKRDTSW